MAHIRRKFVDVFQSQGLEIAGQAIRCIAEPYAVERGARGQPPQDRVRLRQERAKPIFDNLESWLGGQLQKVPGKSEPAKAVPYALTRMKN